MTDNTDNKLRKIRYFRWPGPGHGPDPIENDLLTFIYDVPYFGACGVFPPCRLLNQLLLRGGSMGGTSPGATWEPFALSEEEYRELADAVRRVPPETLRNRARYAHLAFKFDPEFDGAPDTYPVHGKLKMREDRIPQDFKEYATWLSAVCAKHREHWEAELKRAGYMRDS